MRVLERWVKHFLGVGVTIQHRREIDDKQWVWHVGLDAVASSVLNDLYNREAVEDGSLNLYLPVRVLRPGRYVASGRIDDAQGRPFALEALTGSSPEAPRSMSVPILP